MKNIWKLLISLNSCLWLLALTCCIMAAASFRLQGEYAESINSLPLLQWIIEAPLSWSWWLWITLMLLALLALNTVCCSFDTIRRRITSNPVSATLAPQLMHAGFLLIMLAHLASAMWGYHETLQLPEGRAARLPDGRMFAIAAIIPKLGPMGMPLGFSAEIVTDLQKMPERITIAPNKPWLSNGYGVYIKHAEPDPMPWALIEIHREPGAGMAFAGGMLFTAGNLILLVLRGRSREY